MKLMNPEAHGFSNFFMMIVPKSGGLKPPQPTPRTVPDRRVRQADMDRQTYRQTQ